MEDVKAGNIKEENVIELHGLGNRKKQESNWSISANPIISLLLTPFSNNQNDADIQRCHQTEYTEIKLTTLVERVERIQLLQEIFSQKLQYETDNELLKGTAAEKEYI